MKALHSLPGIIYGALGAAIVLDSTGLIWLAAVTALLIGVGVTFLSLGAERRQRERAGEPAVFRARKHYWD